MQEITILAVIIIFYVGIFFGLYLRVQGKNHKSRNVIKSFLFVSGALLAVIILASVFIWLVVSLLELERGGITTAFGTGVVVISFARAWIWSFAKIESPIPGHIFKQAVATKIGNLIPQDQYIQKYKVSEKELMHAISLGKIKSSIESGVLSVEDKKC